MTREGSCRERGGRRVPVLGDDSHPPLHYLLPLFSGFCVCTHVGCLFTFQVVETSSLSWSTRIKGFAACFVAGIVCSLLVRRPSPPPGSSRGPGRRRGSSGGEGHRSSAVLTGLCLPGDSSALGAQEGAVPVRGVLHLWEHRIHWKVTALHQLGPSSPGGKAARLAARVCRGGGGGASASAASRVWRAERRLKYIPSVPCHCRVFLCLRLRNAPGGGRRPVPAVTLRVRDPCTQHRGTLS